MDHKRECKKYDPHGNFVRRWLPVLARLPVEYIHTCAPTCPQAPTIPSWSHISMAVSSWLCPCWPASEAAAWHVCLPACMVHVRHLVSASRVTCRPWEAPPEVLAAAGVELGGNYESPIIMPHESRQVLPT